MKGTAKSKLVTSGRLTGRVKVQLARRRVTPNPVACPELAYSMYSTDSEDQVTSLHKGLDQCAALLSGILQAEKADALPSAIAKPSTSQGKKNIKTLPTQTGQKRCQSVQYGRGSTTSGTTHQSAVPVAHSGGKLHPPQKPSQILPQSHLPPSHYQIPQYLSPTTSPPHPTSHSGWLPVPQTDCQFASEDLHTHWKAECDGEEQDFVPVRDINTQSTGTDTHTAVKHTHSDIDTCALKISNMGLEPGQADKVPQDTHSTQDYSAETEVKMRTIHYLLGELKALIAGQGSVAEKLLSHLEQTMSLNAGSSNIHTQTDLSSVHSHNTWLRRHMRILHKQLKERAKSEGQHDMKTLYDSEVLTLQEELTHAQSRLQDLQDNLTELRKTLQDTQSQLRDREAKNALIQTDLENTQSRLLDSEREKSGLASLAQQRLEEIGHLKRTLQSMNCPTVVDKSVSDTLLSKQHFDQHQHRQDSAEPPTDRITQYLISLCQPEPTHTEHVCVAAGRERNTLEQKKLTSVQQRVTISHPDVRSQRGNRPAETSAHHQNSHFDQSHCLDKVHSCGQWLENKHGQLLNSTLSQCDVESVWSTRSWSTFDTRDEAAFRDGLSALDASIGSLQRTIQLDLGR